MKIEKLPLSKIKAWETNPKIHTDEQIQVIIDSIKQFGMNDPIAVWGDENIIVEGHGRVLALEKMGVEEVDAIRLDHLSDEERRAYALVHNQATMLTDWDFELLDFELEEIEFDLIETPSDDAALDEESGERLSFSVAREQAELIRYSVFVAKEHIVETFGNPSEDGNALYEIIRQWSEMREAR